MYFGGAAMFLCGAGFLIAIEFFGLWSQVWAPDVGRTVGAALMVISGIGIVAGIVVDATSRKTR